MTENLTGAAPEGPQETPDAKGPPATEPPPEEKAPIDRIVIWAWPKTIVFWLTCLVAIICGFAAMIGNPDKHIEAVQAKVQALAADVGTSPEMTLQQVKADLKTLKDEADQLRTKRHKWLAVAFLFTFCFNLVAFSFDVRVKGVVMLVFFIFGATGVLLFLSEKMNVFGFLRNIIEGINPYANAPFFFTIGIVTIVILAVGMVNTYLRRVVITHNEVVIHTGLLQAQNRVSTQQLTFHMRITDLMEHWVLFGGLFSKKLGSGQLVFNHPQLDAPVVLDNVIGVEAFSEQLGEILGVMSVKDEDGKV